MSELELIPSTDPRLHQISDEVSFPLTTEDIHFIVNLKVLMLDKQAIGIAAPQVGVNRRIIALNLDYPRYTELVMINPTIIRRGSTIVNKFREGCLSLPSQYVAKKRNEIVTVEYHDINGVQYQRMFRGLMSICVQHEIDHLNGILMTD